MGSLVCAVYSESWSIRSGPVWVALGWHIHSYRRQLWEPTEYVQFCPRFRPNMLTLLLFLSQLMLATAMPLELGKGGVYDSPLATDRFVREFGFLFGGGRSGVKGIEALQDHNDPMPHHPDHSAGVTSHRDMSHNMGKKMVELSPILVENTKTRKPKMFSRFLAVP